MIVSAIREAELQTSGEIRVHLSFSPIHHEDMLPLAQKEFQKLKMHLTRERNGVLLYINPKIRKFALFGDQGIHEKVGQDYWDQLKNELRNKIRDTDLTTGIISAVHEIGMKLKLHFPYDHRNDQDELKNDLSESD